MAAKKTDHLRRDPPYMGQKYGLISFLNPADKVRTRCIHSVNRFLVDEVNKSFEAQAKHMVNHLKSQMNEKMRGTISKYKGSKDADERFVGELLESTLSSMQVDETEFVHYCTRKYEMDNKSENYFSGDSVLDKYRTYLAANRKKLDEEYTSAYGNEPSLRGFKGRGDFDNLEEAKERAKYLQSIEPAFNVYLYEVGTWTPIDFEDEEIASNKFGEERLNDLMGKYYDNVQARDTFFRERVEESNDPKTREEKTRNRLAKKLTETRAERVREECASLAPAPEDKNESS